MLKKLRSKKTAKKIWVILAILILPAFILWGSGSLIRSREESSYAGRLFGKNISLIEYRDAMEAVKNASIMRFGENFSEIQKYLNLEAQAWDRIILLQEAKRRKIKVSDREVVESIKKYPFFQRRGQFDSKIYAEMLRYDFHTQPRAFEEQTRQNLMLSRLYDAITRDINLSEEEIKKEYGKANEEISLYYITSAPSDFIKGLNPDEDQARDYFEKNSFEFKKPVSFNIDYVALEDETKTNEFTLRLNKRKDFDKAAKDAGLIVKETGLFVQTDAIPGIGWSPEILGLIARMEVGQHSLPVHIDKNYYILKLKERREAYIPEFETVKEKVRLSLIQHQSEKLAQDKIGTCHKKLKELYKVNPKSADFNRAAKEFGLKAESTNPFKYGSYIEGIGVSDNFWTATSKLKDNEFSEVIGMPSGFYIVRLKSRTQIDEKKFEKEKLEFSRKLLSQKKDEYLGKVLGDLKKKAQ